MFTLWNYYLELLQWADSGVKAVLWQTWGQKVNPRLLRGLSVHLFRIHVKVLQGPQKKWLALNSAHRHICTQPVWTLLGTANRPERSRWREPGRRTCHQASSQCECKWRERWRTPQQSPTWSEPRNRSWDTYSQEALEDQNDILSTVHLIDFKNHYG